MTAKNLLRWPFEMATVPLRVPDPSIDRVSGDRVGGVSSNGQSSDGVFGRLAHLAQLELELGLAEARQILTTAAVAIVVAFVALIVLVAGLVVALTGAVAPLFASRWEPFVIGGGGVGVLAVAALAWSALRLRTLHWPVETLGSLEENWQWLAAQLRSRLTLR
jgi:putative superfamily III holin-X